MATVAEIIHQHDDEIMRCWIVEARAAASARGLTSVALENVMSMYLLALADQVETGQLDANDRRRQYLHSHISTRLRQGFLLGEIQREFALLGRCIATMWQSLPDNQWPSAPDVDRLHEQIDVAIAEVADTFHRHMLEDEQAEKRYLRQFQEIASSALHDTSKPLRERGGELLEVVMDAMGAQCAAFLLHDVSRSRLVLVASAGVQEIEAYATSLDPVSFAGEVATSEEATALHGVTSTPLEIPDSLRESGIHSLLGVRLPLQSELLGVMYIGIAEARAFTPRELGLIEALGDRLGLHLENARLFHDLNDKIESLDVEKALRERFVSALAHDLRGPLSAARLAAELLAMEPARLDERRDLAVRIERNIDRVDRMIRDLLDASRMRAGEPFPLRLDTCDLVAVAERVAEEARALHGDRFVVEAEGGVRGIWSEEELRRALWNLVTNAVKYGEPKAPITIAVRRHDSLVRVSVHNAGPPIPAEDQAQIFDAYARTRTAHGSDRTGWGLGLAVVRGVVEAHGGHVWVASDVKSGTMFTIELPVDARSAQPGSDAHRSTTVH